MDLELSEELHATRDLLVRSLIMYPEQAPAMPAGLASDFAARFAPCAKAPQVAPDSWFDRIREFLGTPAFGAVAAAVVVLGVAIPMLPNNESFRGISSPTRSEQVLILFVGDNPQVLAAVKASGNFEASSLVPVNGMVAAGSVPGPKVVVDFTSETITVIDRDGATIDHSSLPTDSAEVAMAIAAALLRL